MGQYLAVVLLLGLGVLFASGSFITNKILVKGRPNAAKVAPYECGIVPTKEPPERFGVGFYLVAMLFIMFDIEIVFLYPYAVSQRELGSFGFFAIALFSAIFFLSFVYEVAKGGLEWGPLHRSRRLVSGVPTDRTTESTIRRVGLEGRDEAA
jgi:NADH-quinone oxidoreductase subunit A